MSEGAETNLDPFYNRDNPTGRAADRNGGEELALEKRRLPGAQSSAGAPAPGAPISAAEILILIEAVARRWPWYLATGVLCAAAGLCIALSRWETRYSARAQLMLYDASHAGDVFKPKAYLIPSLPKLIQSPEVLERVSQRSPTPISVDELALNVKAVPERNSEFVTIAISGPTPRQVVELINLYAEEAIRFTQRMQAKEAAEVKDYVASQVAQVDTDLESLNQKLQALLEKNPDHNTLQANRAAKLTQDLETARTELDKLRIEFQDSHPKVQKQREWIKGLEEELTRITPIVKERPILPPTGAVPNQEPSPTDSEAPLASGASGPLEFVRSQINSQESTRRILLVRLHQAEYFIAHPIGYYRLYAPARMETVVVHSRQAKVLLLALFCAVAGAGAAACVFLVREVLDDRLTTREDVRRVTGLPVAAAVGNLNQLGEKARARTAFRAWLSIQKRVNFSAKRGVVCGLIAANPNEGCATWVNLLAQAANQCGSRVLAITVRPTPNGDDTHPKESPETPNNNSQAIVPIRGTTNFLASPTQITQRLDGPNGQGVLHLMLPEWAWTGEGREQWQSALEHWSQIDNLVILVGLPPASLQNAVLLAQHVPNIIWLTGNAKARAGETRQHVETLREAGCNLVGAVFNQEKPSLLKNLLPRWRAPAS